MRAWSRSVAWWLFVGALAVRGGWVGYCWCTTGAKFHYSDEELHWQIATNLVTRGAFVTDDGRHAARMPCYPLFLAGFARWGDTGMLAARLAQAAIGAAAVVVVARLAREALGPRAEWIAGLLVCVDPFAVFFSNLLLTESLFTFLLLVVVYSAWRLAERPRDWSAAWMLALAGAAAIMTRPSSAALVPLVWVLVVVYRRQRRLLLMRLVLAPVVLVILLLPWGLRNRAVLGSGAWLSTNGGVTLYDAQGPQADGSSNQEFLRGLPALAGRDEVARDQELQRLALNQMRQDPGRVLRLAVAKFTRTWSPRPNVAEYRGGLAAFAGAAYTIVVMLGAVAGLLRLLRASRRQSALSSADELHSLRTLVVLACTAVLYFTLVHCVYIGSVRYRVPLMPLLAVVAASAVASPITRAEPTRP